MRTIEEIVDYASTEFSDGARANPSMIGYDWHDSIYNGVHYPINTNVLVPKKVTDRRVFLADRLDELELDLQKSLSLTEYWYPRLNPTQVTNISNVRDRILHNIELIQDAGFMCYDDVGNCIKYSDSLIKQERTYQKSALYFPSPLYLDPASTRISIDRRGTTSSQVEVNCPIPSSTKFGGAVTGVAAGVGSSVVRRIRVYYRPILSNGTLGQEYFTDCGDRSQGLERTLRAPEDRIFVSYGVGVSDNTVRDIRAEACPIDAYNGRIATEECSFIGTDSENWYSPTKHGLNKESTIIRGIGLSDQQDNIEVMRTETVQLTEKPVSDIRISHSVGIDEGYRHSATGEVFYTVNVQSFGPDDAPNVIVRSFFPDDVYFMSAMGQGSECTSAAGLMTCQIDILESQTSAQIDVTLMADRTSKFEVASEVSTLTNYDPNGDNNFDRTSIGGTCSPGCGTCPEGTTAAVDPALPAAAFVSLLLATRRRKPGAK